MVGWATACVVLLCLNTLRNDIYVPTAVEGMSLPFPSYSSNSSQNHAALFDDIIPVSIWGDAQTSLKSARLKLETPCVAENNADQFNAVEVGLRLKLPLIDHLPGTRKNGFFNHNKNLVGASSVGLVDGGCIAYCMGINDDSSFEQYLAGLGCEVHAFDCTVSGTSKAVLGKNFVFHQWCIGVKSSMSGNTYVENAPHAEDEMEFKTLSSTMQVLGHSRIDILKADIEGFEWQLFEGSFLRGMLQPWQIIFELHAKGSNPRYAPEQLTHDKDCERVRTLFLKFLNMGYVVVSKEQKRNHLSDAEFNVIRRPNGIAV